MSAKIEALSDKTTGEWEVTEQYEGRVLSWDKYEIPMDWYREPMYSARVWTGSEVITVSTKGAAIVDATDEVRQAVYEWAYTKRYAEQLERVLQEDVNASKDVEVKGAHIEVVSGRKVPVGTKGVVFWSGLDNWGNYKIGFQPDDGGQGLFTVSSNCKRLDVTLSDVDELLHEAHERTNKIAKSEAGIR